MGKRVLFLGVLLLILILPFVISAENDTEASKVANAYNCLETKIDDKCDDLSTEEKIFSLLATGKCKNELIENSRNEECFPKSSCNIKSTAQAVLALGKAGSSTEVAEEWLLEQNKTPEDLTWYLQIDSDQATVCTISYGGSDYNIAIGENKKINSGAGCLSPAQQNYWLEIGRSCYDQEFTISCDKPFITSLLFKKSGSSKFFVSSDTSSASAEGRTIEKINSFCFTQDSKCDYLGSLWATMVLDHLGYDVSSFMPYLVTMAETNKMYLPESFLYSLTADTDYRLNLLAKQKLDYWDESGDKFYDTALALLAFQHEEPQEKSNSIDWLLEVQDNQGCWKGNIRNTAFLLYSVWPRSTESSGGGDLDDCEIHGDGFCMSSVSCEEAGGTEIYSYSASCYGVNVCCDREKLLDTCDELNGEECLVGEECSTSTIPAFDTLECCLGYCREPVSVPDCELYGGACRGSCLDSEDESSDTCNVGEVCCIEKPEPEKKNYLWIWILAILIVLVLIAIIFRDKLRPFWFRIKSKFSKKPRGPPGGPMGRPLMRFGLPQRSPQMRFGPRKVLPPSGQTRPPVRRPSSPPRRSKELDDVLKKLKEMGK